jgi:hypothetical protein
MRPKVRRATERSGLSREQLLHWADAAVESWNPAPAFWVALGGGF